MTVKFVLRDGKAALRTGDRSFQTQTLQAGANQLFIDPEHRQALAQPDLFPDIFSGTQLFQPALHVRDGSARVRELLLRSGQKPPKEFSRPEVAEILIEAMADRTR